MTGASEEDTPPVEVCGYGESREQGNRHVRVAPWMSTKTTFSRKTSIMEMCTDQLTRCPSTPCQIGYSGPRKIAEDAPSRSCQGGCWRSEWCHNKIYSERVLTFTKCVNTVKERTQEKAIVSNSIPFIVDPATWMHIAFSACCTRLFWRRM